MDLAFDEVLQALVAEFELRNHLPVFLPQVPVGELLFENEGEQVDDLGSDFLEQGARKLAQSFTLHFQTLALGFSPRRKNNSMITEDVMFLMMWRRSTSNSSLPWDALWMALPTI